MAKQSEVEAADAGWTVAREHGQNGRHREALRAYLAIIEDSPTAANYWRVDREIQALDLQSLATSPNQTVRIGILGSSTLDVLCAHVRVDCLRAGLIPHVYQGGYGQAVQAVLDGNSPLYAFRPELVFLSLRLDELIPQLKQPESRVPSDLVPRVLQEVKRLATAFTARSQALLVIHNVLIPAHSVRGILENKLAGGERLAIAGLNRALEEAFRDSRQVFILDYEHLSSQFGKDRMRDARMSYLADMDWSDDFVAALSDAYLGYIKPAKGILRKCIVVDLDDTLWGGVLGESGFDGIQLDLQRPGSQFRDFQRLLLDLHRRGILLAINSHNNAEEAMAVIRTHPHMILREQHFAAIQINWDDKVANMRRIAKELNVGLESLVFLDDNPAQRLYMRQALPEVLTVELPPDPALYRQAIERLNDFNVLSLTEEDLRRGELYAAESARNRLLGESASLEDFLASLKMTLTIEPADAFAIPRIAQLTQRTNQFNLTTRRYSEAEIERLAASSGHAVYALKVTDIFGDSGLVGVAILRTPDGPTWELDSFLLSCRVLGRRIETYWLHVLLELARQRGARSITGEFIPTPKNEVAKRFYPEHGFRLVEERDGASRWELSLEGGTFEVPAWVTIHVAKQHVSAVKCR
jgi:FkbH-like protein